MFSTLDLCTLLSQLEGVIVDNSGVYTHPAGIFSYFRIIFNIKADIVHDKQTIQTIGCNVQHSLYCLML